MTCVGAAIVLETATTKVVAGSSSLDRASVAVLTGTAPAAADVAAACAAVALRLRTSTASHHAPGADLLVRIEAKKGKEVKTRARLGQGLQDLLHRMAH